jgi:hypothetical protein
MAMTRRILGLVRRVWNSPGVIGLALGVAAWIFGLRHVNALERTSPPTPELAYGETVPVRWGAGMVYMTARDANFVHWFPLGGMLTILAVFALLSWREHRNKQSRRD